VSVSSNFFHIQSKNYGVYYSRRKIITVTQANGANDGVIFYTKLRKIAPHKSVTIAYTNYEINKCVLMSIITVKYGYFFFGVTWELGYLEVAVPG